MKLATAALLLASTAAADVLKRPYLAPRQATSNAPACPNLSISGNGGRKIAIVVDTSGSNSWTDPSDLRVVAARTLNDALVSNAEAAASGTQADLVTVVDFDGSAAVIYELGDPAGAIPFDLLDSSGSTYIASGVEAAVAELTKGSDTTAGRTGIVVLTDGSDSYSEELVQALNNATAQGIRVSFGFLPEDSSAATDPDVQAAILRTGGKYAIFSSAESQQSFVNLVLANGLTNGLTSSNTSSTLVSGLSITAFVSANGPNEFVYNAQAGEALSFNLTSITAGTLDATLTDASGAELKTASTDTNTTFTVDVPSAGELVLSVTASNTSTAALFQVGVSSSLGISNCILTPGNTTVPSNTTAPGNRTNTTVPSSTVSRPAQYTGGAVAMAGSQGLATAAFATLSFALAAFLV
ncbi:hypothetical protein H2201_002433 [Coniosporium apollinis]|uniref:VWFA domain-containing protein n=2 Tax=Coniosporium TaxID=2810619 RepID=A0ABQ9P1Z1_9PEZI|nr:hypothetical protein H2199_001802 [Cladosporium sp. JES 115]KAJ9667564.1 hypothetical protein H2201_002433 [Coniosporium apollinis]